MGSERSKSKRSGLSRLKAASKGLAKCIAELKAAKAAKQRVLTTPESERIRIRQWVTNAREVYDDKEKLLKHPFQLSTRWTIGGWEGVPAASCTFEKFLEKYAFTLYGGWTEALDENGKPLLELVNGERTQIYRLYPLKLLPGWVETETYAHGEPLYYKYPLKSNGEPDLTELLETTDDRPDDGTPDLSDLEEYHDEQYVRPGSGLTEEEMKHATLMLSLDDLTKDSYGGDAATTYINDDSLRLTNMGMQGMLRWGVRNRVVRTIRAVAREHPPSGDQRGWTFEKFFESDNFETGKEFYPEHIIHKWALPMFTDDDLTKDFDGNLVKDPQNRGTQGKAMLIKAKKQKLKKVIVKSQHDAEAAKEAKLKEERAAYDKLQCELTAEKNTFMKEMREADVQSKKILGTSSSILNRWSKRCRVNAIPKYEPEVPTKPSRRLAGGAALIARFQREAERCASS